jgi:hypothetical protein
MLMALPSPEIIHVKEYPDSNLSRDGLINSRSSEAIGDFGNKHLHDCCDVAIGEKLTTMNYADL